MNNQFITHQLGEVADIIAGGDKPKKFSLEKTSSIHVPVLANAEKNNGLLGYTNTARIFEPAVTVAARGSNVGFVANRKEPFFPVVRLLSLIPNKERLDVDYLFYNLKQNRKKGTGSGQPQITIPDISSKTISLPPVSEQKNVAKVLSTLDEKIELNNLINTELEAMAKLIYDYWFVQFDFPDNSPQGQGKPYKSSGGKMAYNEDLKREIPEGWCSDYVGNLLAKESRTKKLPKTAYLTEGEIPVIDQSTDFICGYTNDLETSIEAKEPRIVFGDHTRILKLINFDFARGADGTQVLLSNNSNVPQHFFYHSLLKIDLSSYGYARHFKFLKETRTIVPDFDVVTKFEGTVKSFYDQIKHNIFETNELETLRDWLLPMLMNGQVTIRDDLGCRRM